MTETLVQRAAEQGRSNPLEQLVAQPVSLDDPCVQRVVQAVGGGDKLQVGSRALERAQRLAQPPVDYS